MNNVDAAINYELLRVSDLRHNIALIRSKLSKLKANTDVDKKLRDATITLDNAANELYQTEIHLITAQQRIKETAIKAGGESTSGVVAPNPVTLIE